MWWNTMFGGTWIFGVWRFFRENFEMLCIAKESGLWSLRQQHVSCRGSGGLVLWLCWFRENSAGNELNSEIKLLHHMHLALCASRPRHESAKCVEDGQEVTSRNQACQ